MCQIVLAVEIKEKGFISKGFSINFEEYTAQDE